MRQLRSAITLGCAFAAASLTARAAADDVHLDNGEVIEGRATREGDTVLIELPCGQLRLSAQSVRRIDKRESSIDHYEKLYGALKPDDVAKRVQLANYCRDHDMRDRERLLLQEVIEREPDHAEARARLGYVKSGSGWISYAQYMRAQGNVQRAGQWVSRERALELDREQARGRAAHEGALADSDLEAKKVELERQKLELERQKLELERARAAQPSQPVLGYYGGFGWGYGYQPGGRVGWGRHGAARAAQRGAASSAFPINGVRDPRDDSWSLPGVRDPRDDSWSLPGVRNPRDGLP